MIYRSTIKKLMLERQYLSSPAEVDEYEKLFRQMSPVQPVFWTYPGAPPSMYHRASFNDWEHNYSLRADRVIIKARCQGGSVGYFYFDETELFEAAFAKDRSNLSFPEMEMLSLFEQEGPMNVGVIKRLTGMRSKDIAPILHKLQSKFILYEDQIDDEGDRAWYLFKDEFPELDFDKYTRTEAIRKFIKRFAYLNVFFNEEMLRSYYSFSLKDIKPAIAGLLDEQVICEERTDKTGGYVLMEDHEMLKTQSEPEKSIYILHRSDYIVKSNETYLKDKFKNIRENIVYYVMIDGEIEGVITGRFSFGPIELYDAVVTINENEAAGRMDEIVYALYKIVDQTESPLQKYMGTPL